MGQKWLEIDPHHITKHRIARVSRTAKMESPGAIWYGTALLLVVRLMYCQQLINCADIAPVLKLKKVAIFGEWRPSPN